MAQSKVGSIIKIMGVAVIGCMSALVCLNGIYKKPIRVNTSEPELSDDEDDGEYLFLNNVGNYKNEYDDVWNNASDEERDVFTRRSEQGKSLKEVFETPVTTEEISETIDLMKKDEEERARETFSILDGIKERRKNA